jgi:hypothetical protein
MKNYMNTQFLSCSVFIRHAELVSVFYLYDNERIVNDSLKQAHGDFRVIMLYGHSLKIILNFEARLQMQIIVLFLSGTSKLNCIFVKPHITKKLIDNFHNLAL